MCSTPVPTLDELAVEFDRAHAALRGVNSDQEEDYDAAIARLVSICQQIVELPPQTLEHLRLKARAFLWHEHPDQREPVPTGQRLAYQIASAMLEGVHLKVAPR